MIIQITFLILVFIEASLGRGKIRPELKVELPVHGVIPDVIHDMPNKVVNITFPDGVSIHLAKRISRQRFNPIPEVSWEANPKYLYTLCMVDPDTSAEPDPFYKEWVHWLVVNIPGTNVSAGDIIYEYVGYWHHNIPDSLHRYVFVVYEQPGKLNFTEPFINKTTGKSRENFKIHDFAEKYKLSLPLACNFFLAGVTDY